MIGNSNTGSSVRFVGVEPWLPWPLSSWRWWTDPVPAERLAVLRIGLALFLVIDILRTYWPNLDAFFLDSGPSGARVFGWNTQAPHWTWSALRGLGDPVLLTMILASWVAATLGCILDWLTRRRSNGTATERSMWSFGLLWLVSSFALTGGSWSRAWLTTPPNGQFAWIPGIMAGAALGATLVETVLLRFGKSKRTTVWRAAGCVMVHAGLTALGMGLDAEWFDLRGLVLYLGPWQNDAGLLRAAAILWVLSSVMLLLGWQTRVAAVATWILNTSFANINPYIDNAGDVIRAIVLFYLMLCPCGAVWSLDRWWERRTLVRSVGSGSIEQAARIVVASWPLRLLFLQLVFIYFMNGIYKLGGDHWLRGDSLHYVLCDVTLTRFSYAQFPVPLWLTQMMTWTVLLWEVGFPLWVSLPWTRKPALCFGVLFHLGIYATMELGNFVPYALTLYLPLLPWERIEHARLGSRHQR